MFDFAWTQIGLIGVVALVLIGPKDLPVAIRTVAGLVKKARRMAGEFQGHVDEMVKDTELADIRNQISEIRSFNIRREVEKAVDADGSLRASFQQDPFHPDPFPLPSAQAGPSLTEGGIEAEAGSVSIAPSAPSVTVAAAPAFVPPQAAASAAAQAEPPPMFDRPSYSPPAFVPPAASETRPAA